MALRGNFPFQLSPFLDVKRFPRIGAQELGTEDKTLVNSEAM